MPDDTLENLNNQNTEVEESEDTNSESTEESTEETQDTTDWKAKYEEAESARVKAENDKKAIQGARKKQSDVDSMLTDILSRQEASEKAQAALIKALAQGDTDTVADELNNIQSESNKTRAQARFQNAYNSLYETMQEAVLDEDGNEIIDLEKDERLADFRNEVITAHNNGDLAGISTAMNKLYRVVNKVERENSKAAVEKAREEAETKAKKKIQKAGLGDHDLGNAPAGGSNLEGLYGFDKIKYGLEKQNK